MSKIENLCTIIASNTYPTVPCPFALNSITSSRGDNFVKAYLFDIKIITEEKCDWYINDENSCYCFWKFWSNPDNVREYTLEEIAQLNCVTPGTIHEVEEKARIKLTLALIDEGVADTYNPKDIENLRLSCLDKLRKLEEFTREYVIATASIHIRSVVNKVEANSSNVVNHEEFSQVMKFLPFVPQKQMELFA